MDFKTMFINTFNKEKYDLLEKSFTMPSYRGLRLSNFKIINESFYKDLEKHPYVKNAFIYPKLNQNYGKLPYHEQGIYYIQEPSAMLVGELLDVKPTDLVIDLCAAPGGKSTHVAHKLNEDGLLVSNEINYKRALDLSENIERMGIKNSIIINTEVSKISSYYQGLFDKVILDAPCSGEGMFRKNTLMKDDWSIEKVKSCQLVQKSLILDAYKLLKFDGIMIYSTCTFNKLENEDIINYLLENTNAELIMLPIMDNVERGINMKEAIRLFPYLYKGEGHFICKIRCKDYHDAIYKKNKTIHLNDKELISFYEFTKSALNIKFDKSRLFINNEHLYYLPKNALNTYNLRVLKNGLYLGELKKNYFIPSHAFALSSVKDDWKNIYELNEEQVIKFLKGDSFEVNEKNGFYLLTYKNNSIGFAKIANNILKNHYPKHLRI